MKPSMKVKHWTVLGLKVPLDPILSNDSLGHRRIVTATLIILDTH